MTNQTNQNDAPQFGQHFVTAFVYTLAVGMFLMWMLGMGGCEPPESPTYLPICDVQQYASTFIVQCGNETATCSDGQGKPRYVDCELPNGNTLVTCVAKCP